MCDPAWDLGCELGICAGRAASSTRQRNPYIFSKPFRGRRREVSSGTPRQSVTATQLLSLGVPRIAREFPNDPELRIELLGAMGEIYAGLSDLGSAELVEKKQIALARQFYGDRDPIVVLEMIGASWNAMNVQDWTGLAGMLDDSDKLLHEDRQDDSALRAEWWVLKANWLSVQSGQNGAEQRDLLRSTELFARHDPIARGYQEALSALGVMHFLVGDYDGAGKFFRQAIAVSEAKPDHQDLDLAADIANLAQVQENQGDSAGAAAGLARAAKLALEAGGNQNGVYWYAMAQQAKLMDMRGDWKPALAMLNSLWQQRSANSPSENVQYQVRLLTAQCQIREGNGAAMIPVLRAALSVLRAKPAQADDEKRVLLALADAYDQAGQEADAVATFRLVGADVSSGQLDNAVELTRRRDGAGICRNRGRLWRQHQYSIP